MSNARPAARSAGVLAAIALAATLVAVGEPDSAAGRKVRCGRNQVAVKVNRRTVSCRSLASVLPKPRKGDTRLLLARSALADDLVGLRDRRGRRAPSLRNVLGEVGRHVYLTLQSALPQGLTRLDRLSASAARASRSAVTAGRLSRCGGPPPPVKSDTYSSSSGGVRMTAKVTSGPVGALDLQIEHGGYEIRARVGIDECAQFKSPPCPTAAGVLDATDQSSEKVSLEVAKGGTVLLSRSVEFAGQTRMQARVGDDAKLDHVDIEDTQTANIDLGGTGQAFGPINLLYTGLHHARVEMPGGTYVPDQSAVDISLTTRGVTVGKSDLGQAANSIAGDLDQSFAALVRREIANFKHLENGWNTPNTCVKLKFTPASRTLKLRRGAHGSMSAQALDVQHGGTARGHWTRTTQQNATFTPASAQGTDPSFSYQVTKAGKGIIVAASLRVTSKAGVGQGTWEQETEDAPLYRGEVHDTLSIDSGGTCPEQQQSSYSASLAPAPDQPFSILDPGSVYGSDEQATGTYTLPPCDNLPGCSSTLSDDPNNSATVFFDAQGDGTVGVTLEPGNLIQSGGPCSVHYVTLYGSFPQSMIGEPTIPVDLSYHDAQINISGTLTLTRAN